MIRVLTFCLSLILAGPLQAQSHPGCTPIQSRIVSEALSSAKDLTLNAAVAVGDDRHYHRWFGEYSARNAEHVRASLKGIVTALRNGRVTVTCMDVRPGECEAGQYAFVYPSQAYELYVCPAFFTLPVLETLRPGARRSNFGTQEGSIVHEVSHFPHVADTEDHCYSRTVCADMAAENARQAIENADSYQYYTEDVTYFARRPVEGKPPPAPRPSRN